MVYNEKVCILYTYNLTLIIARCKVISHPGSDYQLKLGKYMCT